MQNTLDQALDLLADLQAAYAQAPGHLRRQGNQALFQQLLVTDDEIADAPLAEPFATLTDPQLPAQLADAASTATNGRNGHPAPSLPTRTAALPGGGSRETSVVGATGFEPMTSCSQSRRATRLRYAPFSRVYGRPSRRLRPSRSRPTRRRQHHRHL